MNDVIVAIATPIGRGAIGIVRMSGEGALKIFKRVWKSKAHPVDKFATHCLYVGNIVDLSTGEVIDKVIVSLMKGPHSYTGEDVIEISCHGGTEVLRSILGQLISTGARVAEPGEFTRRAFLNGKMDLVQAEAVAALIDSRSVASARLAKEQLEGRLSGSILGLRDRLKKVLAYVETTIDFPEEDTEFIEDGEVEKTLSTISKDLQRLIGSYDYGRVIREGVKVVIAGPPNAGKSSLLNALLGADRAIVHHVPGTTRDTIEEEAVIEGISFRLIDTAGIRMAEEEIEEIGVMRSKKAISVAEVVLLVVDSHEFMAIEPQFVEELKDVKHVIIVVNKKDMGIRVSQNELDSLFSNRPICEISAKTGEGLEHLGSTIVAEVIGGRRLQEREDVIITSSRHRGLLQKCASFLDEAEEKLEKKESAEFVAVHIRGALDCLGEIVGEVTTEDILNEIFSNFCIGK